MIKAEKLSYGFPQKDLYNKISFTIEEKQHCALIGSNGTGKTTLIDMIRHSEDYLYDGKLTIEPGCTMGFVSQFYERGENEDQDVTVFDYIAKEFVRLEGEIARLCEEMAVAEDMEAAFEAYQTVLDQFTAMDGDYYESNIKKQLKTANLLKVENLPLNQLSGGEFKLVQMIREMMMHPRLLIMDEPDVFLDFEHLTALVDLINGHPGTMLVITHNRYLLNHCFNKILHLENMELREFEGNYIEYNFLMLQEKMLKQEMAAADQAEIERNEKMVERLRKRATAIDNSSFGRALHAKVSMLERLEARKTKDPFINLKEPRIELLVPEKKVEQVEASGGPVDAEGVAPADEKDDVVLRVSHYNLAFDEELLTDVSFELKRGDKVAIVGKNGTGKTTMLREIAKGENSAIKVADGIVSAYLSQIQGEMLDEKKQVYQEFESDERETEDAIFAYLEPFGFEKDVLYSRIGNLSGGEKNLLQVAKIAAEPADLLLLDEPTSHLDTYTQIALEEAIAAYKGTVLMISHDFYTIVNCADYILFVEDQGIRQVSTRKFRKMIYEEHFDKNYLELEQKKKELEQRITAELKHHRFEQAKVIAEDLEVIVNRM